MKNLKNYKYILTALSLAIALFSCNKSLNLNPKDQISDASSWQTPNDFKLAANAFYLYERSFVNSFYDYPTDNTRLQPHSDNRSDLVSQLPNVYSDGSNQIVQADNNYSTDYTRIRNINYMLDKAAAYATPATIKQYVAEAKFFRAYVYFDLLQLYGGATIVKTSLNVTSPELTAARNTRDEVTDFIISDLNASITDLPLQSTIAGTDQGRVSQGAAQAFLSRVALYEGTWQKFRGNTARATTLLTTAVAAGNSVISSTQYTLFKPAALGDSALKYMFIMENQKSNPANITKAANTEYILSNRYDQTIRVANINITKQAFNNVLYVTSKFANLFLCSDGLPVSKSPLFQGYNTMVSEYQNRDNRMKYTLAVPHKNFWTNLKYRIDWNGDAADVADAAIVNFIPNSGSGYSNQKWGSERNVPDNQESYDYPVIRYAEVLLNYAEATFELNGSITDADLDKSINLVRNRVNTTMPKLSTAFVAANALDMRTEIRRERTIELYLEGFRIDDLKRWKTAETEMPMPLLGVKWTGTEFQTTWSGANTLPKDANGNIILQTGRIWADKNYLLPLPAQQVQLNPKLGQNPGW